VCRAGESRTRARPAGGGAGADAAGGGVECAGGEDLCAYGHAADADARGGDGEDRGGGRKSERQREQENALPARGRGGRLEVGKGEDARGAGDRRGGVSAAGGVRRG